MFHQNEIIIDSDGRGTIEFTTRVADLVASSNVVTGLCQLFIHHTSASLLITENADTGVRVDLEHFFGKLVKDGDPAYSHDQEGPDDMAAHIRSVLGQCELTIPIKSGRLDLGTWQGIFLWEHRFQAHRRRITVTVYGSNA